MKKFKFTIHGNQYETEILKVEENIAEIEVNGTIYQVEVDKAIKVTKTPTLIRNKAVPSTEGDKSTVKTSKPSDPKGTGHVKSPLPGTVIKIFVKVGDKIQIGERLLIMEAMKMENNINSDRDGVVKAIKVNEGDSVMEGDILIEVGG